MEDECPVSHGSLTVVGSYPEIALPAIAVPASRFAPSAEATA